MLEWEKSHELEVCMYWHVWAQDKVWKCIGRFKQGALLAFTTHPYPLLGSLCLSPLDSGFLSAYSYMLEFTKLPPLWTGLKLRQPIKHCCSDHCCSYPYKQTQVCKMLIYRCIHVVLFYAVLPALQYVNKKRLLFKAVACPLNRSAKLSKNTQELVHLHHGAF